MEKEPTKEEVERRAKELARRVMSTPPQPRTKPKPAKETGGASKPRKRGRAASGS